jgi:hypothetical protein
MRLMASLVALGVLAGGLGWASLAPVAGARPLAQATATPTATPIPTATPTPTLPPVVDLGSGWLVQPLPRASVNCIIDPESGQFVCVSGTAVPP